MVIVAPSRDASRALARRLSSICSIRPGVTNAAGPRQAGLGGGRRVRRRVQTRRRGVPRRQPEAGSHAVLWSAVARASVSRPSTRAESRSTSVSAPSSSGLPGAATSRSRFSSRRRSAARGVRSWCEASARNASWERTSASTFAPMVVEGSARRRTSGGPSTVAPGGEISGADGVGGLLEAVEWLGPSSARAPPQSPPRRRGRRRRLRPERASSGGRASPRRTSGR